MRLKKLTVEGFESAAQRVEVDFEGKQMLAFVGENGSGKSMLSIWAVVFALYGKVRTRTIGEAISTSAGQAYVELEFSANNNDYRIIRKLPRIGRQEATLYVFDDSQAEWTPMTEKEVKSTNAAIVDVVGMDYESARTTFIAEQGNYGMFCEGTPMERRHILTQLLNLQGYEELKEAADARFKAATLEIAAHEAQLEEIDRMRDFVAQGNPKFSTMSDEDIEEELANLHEEDQELQKREAEEAFKRDNAQNMLTAAQDAITKFYQDRDNQIERNERTIVSLRRLLNPARINSIEKDLEKVDEGRLRLKEIEPKIADLDTRITKGKNLIADLEIDVEGVQDNATKKVSDQSVVDAALVDLDQQESDLKKSAQHGATCTTCSQPLSKELLQTVLSAINTRRNDLLTQKKSLESEVERLREEFRTKRKDIKVKKEWLEKYENEISTLRQNQAGINQIMLNADRLRTALKEAQDEQREASMEIDTITAEQGTLRALEAPEELTTKLTEAQQNYNAMTSGDSSAVFDYSGRAKIAELEREIAQRDTARSKEAAFDARKKEVETNLAKARVDEDHYGILRKAFSPTGIPAMIMAGALQELEDDANRYLEKFSKGTLSLNLETQKETQKGKINEEIIVTINAPDGTRDYSSFSGGQKFRIDLSIRIAMCKVSARRSGAAAVETLFIDEGFGALDESGKLSTLAALTELSEEMAVVSVSHIDSVKEGFPDLIEVSLDSGTTTVREIKTSGV